MSLNIKTIKFVTLFFLGVLLLGCTKEDLSQCHNIFNLKFEYTNNADEIDKFAQDVDEVQVYVFNADGSYVDSYHGFINGLHTFQFPIELPYGTYDFVVWGGVPNSYTISNLSSYENAKLAIHPKDSIIDFALADLFHGELNNIKLTPTHKDSLPNISLIKNSNILNLTIKGVDLLPNSSRNNDLENRLTISCQSKNGTHNFDNSIEPNAPLIHYTPYEQTTTSNTLRASIKTMRLLTNMKATLVVHDTHTQTDLFNKDLIDLLLLLPTINNDSDLDKYDTHNIEITIDAHLGVSVNINGYVVEGSESEI